MGSDTTDVETMTTMTFEAYADTLIPGEKRWPDDRTVAGAAPGPGAVAAGAVTVLRMPEGGLETALDDFAHVLNGHAQAYATEHGLTLDESVPAFVSLPFADRTALVRTLTAPEHPEKEFWVAIAMFCYMAFDAAPYLHTADAIAAGHPGLTTLGFAPPDVDGLWRFPHFSYGRQLANLHPDTTPSGSPA